MWAQDLYQYNLLSTYLMSSYYVPGIALQATPLGCESWHLSQKLSGLLCPASTLQLGRLRPMAELGLPLGLQQRLSDVRSLYCLLRESAECDLGLKSCV